MGSGYSVAHAAALAAQLPGQSRCMVFADARNAFTAADRLLEAIEYNTHVAWWFESKDGQRRRNRPKPAGLDAAARKPKGRGKAMDVDEYAAFLARPRKEATHGG